MNTTAEAECCVTSEHDSLRDLALVMQSATKHRTSSKARQRQRALHSTTATTTTTEEVRRIEGYAASRRADWLKRDECAGDKALWTECAGVGTAVDGANAVITIAIRLRYDYDPTTTYRARLLPFDAIRREQKMNMSIFRCSRVVVVS